MGPNRLLFVLITTMLAVLAALGFGIFTALHPLKAGVAALGLAGAGVLIFHGYKSSKLGRYSSFYLIGFIPVLLLAWSPLKSLAYLSPMLFIAVFVIALSTERDASLLYRLLGLITAWAVLSALYAFFYDGFVIQNTVIAFFTYSSFFPLLLIPARHVSDPALFERMMKILLWVLIVEAVIGILQGLYGLKMRGSFAYSAGDFVDGTIHLHPDVSGSLSSVMYAFNMMLGLLGLGLYAFQWRRPLWIVLALCALALVMTAAVHLLLVFVAALAGAFIFFQPFIIRSTRQWRTLAQTALLVGLFTGLTVIMLSGNLKTMGNRIDIIKRGDNQKIEMVTRLFREVPATHPAALYTGFGPGQFASRASAISAGYLGVIPPPFKFNMTYPFATYVLDLWHAWYGKFYKGASNSPASSWAAFISEFGLPAFLMVSLGVGMLLLKIRRAGRMPNQRLMAFFIGTGVLTIYGAGAVGYYWEIPQTIFAGLLILKCMYAMLIYGSPVTEGNAPAA